MIVPVKTGSVSLVMKSRRLLSLVVARVNDPGTSVGGWVSTVNVSWKLLPGNPLPEGRARWLPLASRL